MRARRWDGTGNEKEAMRKLPPLISAMTKPDFYPHQPATVELKQTHISYVLLAGEYVYKVKKPVRFAFLDYSTIDKRYHFCKEEIRLNRRLAPKVYLGVIPITEQDGNFAIGREGDLGGSTIVDFAVKMHRLPKDRMLDTLLIKEEIGNEEICAIAKKLASFHECAATDQASTYGSPEEIWQRFATNSKETEQFVGKTISRKDFKEIKEYGRRFITKNQKLFKARASNLKIREGHGDLRAEHICLIDDIAIFDCIEFDERLRYCDVASEIAFLAMDLDFLRASELSKELVSSYATISRDEGLSVLLPFYKSYQAYVRGKVQSLKSLKKEVLDVEGESTKALARRYFHLAYRYTNDRPYPALLAVCGMVGTGKSTVAQILGDRTGFEVLNSDTVRKRLARIPKTVHVPEEYQTRIYNNDFTRLTYETLLGGAERSLRAGKGVIVDATFKEPRYRKFFLNLAACLRVPVFFIECQAKKPEIFRRLRERERRSNEVSDATWEIYLRHQREFVPFSDIPEHCHLQLDTESEIDDAVSKVESLLWQKKS